MSRPGNADFCGLEVEFAFCKEENADMSRVAVHVILIVGSCSGVDHAQSTNASVSGRVTDPSMQSSLMRKSPP